MAVRAALASIVAIFAFFAAFSTYWYTCHIKGLCESNAPLAAATTTSESTVTSTISGAVTATKKPIVLNTKLSSQMAAVTDGSSVWVPGSVTDDCLPYLAQDIHPDTPKTQVVKLQHFLNAFEGAQIRESGVYDSRTRNAVTAFQIHYKPVLGDVLGVVDLKSRELITHIVCNAAKTAARAQ